MLRQTWHSRASQDRKERSSELSPSFIILIINY
jgi:hypothetical protein